MPEPKSPKPKKLLDQLREAIRMKNGMQGLHKLMAQLLYG
jgi:hypothetical protein